MSRVRPKRSEADVKREVVRLLKRMNILCFRMQSGAMFGSYKGKTWKVALNPSGTADLLAFPRLPTVFVVCGERVLAPPLWIETKSSTGTQSPEQKEFQRMVEAEGHAFLLVRSAKEVWDYLNRTEDQRFSVVNEIINLPISAKQRRKNAEGQSGLNHERGR